MPPVPAFVTSDVGQRIWNEYGPALNRLGLLEFLDATAFSILCESVAGLEDIRREWSGDQRYTIRVGTNGSEQPNPLLAEMRNATKGVLTQLEAFGLTPVGRQKLTGSTAATPIDLNADPMAALANEITDGIPDQPQPPV